MFRYLNHSKEYFGEILYAHNGLFSHRCAFELKEKVNVCLKIPTDMAATDAKISIYTENGAFIKSQSGVWCGRSYEYEFYRFEICKLDVGLYFFELSASGVFGEMSCANYDMEKIILSKERADRFQLSVSDFKYKAPNKYGGVIYQIFVDRFARSDKIIKKSGGVYPENFEIIPEYPAYPGAPLKNNSFYGGNLFGIANRLEYFKSLGVNMLYLTPIFEASSNHKYDTADYMRVDSGFGGEEALVHLIKSAEKEGISIILDGVFNHTGADSIYFNKYQSYATNGAYNSKSSPYYAWYEFQSYPDKYKCWWDVDILPRISPLSASFREFISGSCGVIEKYTALGVSGFRLDVVDELEDDFVKSIRQRQSKTNENSFLYGEVWEDASNKIAYGKRKQYYLGSELDGVMNYPIRRGIIDFIMGRGYEKLKYALFQVYNNAPKRISNFQMNLLGSHDTPRILTVLSDSFNDRRENFELATERMTESQRSEAASRLRCAYTILATLPGIPMIYYADEVGLEGYSDPFNRLPYPYGREDFSLLEHFRKMGAIRQKHSVYRKGEFEILRIDSEVLLFARYSGAYAYITAVNGGAENLKIKFENKAKNLLDGSMELMYNLCKNEAAVFKVRRSHSLQFKKELKTEAL